MRKTKKMINVVVRDENEKLVYFWNMEPGTDIKEFEKRTFDALHKIDEIAGIPARNFHSDVTEIKVYC